MNVLVVVDHARAADSLRRVATVVHTASPRLFVVRVDPDSVADLEMVPGVIAVAMGELPESVTARLDESEAIFAAAFAARPEAEERIGNGLPWDAPGFEPPDASPERVVNGGNESADNRPNTTDGRGNDV